MGKTVLKTDVKKLSEAYLLNPLKGDGLSIQTGILCDKNLMPLSSFYLTIPSRL